MICGLLCNYWQTQPWRIFLHTHGVLRMEFIFLVSQTKIVTRSVNPRLILSRIINSTKTFEIEWIAQKLRIVFDLWPLTLPFHVVYEYDDTRNFVTVDFTKLSKKSQYLIKVLWVILYLGWTAQKLRIFFEFYNHLEELWSLALPFQIVYDNACTLVVVDLAKLSKKLIDGLEDGMLEDGA